MYSYINYTEIVEVNLFAFAYRLEDIFHRLLPVKKSQCQNVPMSKRPIVITSQVKTSQVKTSQVKTSQSQNVPSQNVSSKRPRVKASQVKTSQVKTSQIQNVLSQNVPSLGQNLIHMVCKLIEAYMIGWLVCVV